MCVPLEAAMRVGSRILNDCAFIRDLNTKPLDKRGKPEAAAGLKACSELPSEGIRISRKRLAATIEPIRLNFQSRCSTVLDIPMLQSCRLSIFIGPHGAFSYQFPCGSHRYQRRLA